ncbi:FAD-dependent monooxygenase [Microbacterium sp. RD1]|uniref:FAD-dependent monooxygenase n=1 Tax=Microbacterium sp. RD1 TaxID=3457313 RepID=UPI003FA5EAFE
MTYQGREVAVVGGGPVGATAALLLAVRGLRVHVIEASWGPSDEPKAISIDDESLRTYAQAGVLAEVLGIIVPGLGTRYYGADGRPVFTASAAVPGALGYPFKNPFAQPDLEHVLHGAMVMQPSIQVSYRTRMVDLSQDADGVEITVESFGRRSVMHADYLLGADGGRSDTRALAGIGMTGRSHPEVWAVIDTLNDSHRERFGMHFGTPDRPHVIVPGLDGRCRYEFRLFPGEGDAGEVPDAALIQRLLAPYRTVGRDDVERAINYRFHGLNADDYRRGRVFLLGDAAHMMPPFAGQGLNSGIRDAANLAWKLAEVMHGRLDESVLDTYQAERRPHAAAVIDLSERLGRIVMTPSERVADFRDRVIKARLGSAEGRDYFEHMRYRPLSQFQSALVVPGTGAGVMIRQPRIFDMTRASMVGLDEVLGNGWAIVGVDVTEEDWGTVSGVRAALDAVELHLSISGGIPSRTHAQRVIVDYDGSAERDFGALGGHFVLIRPDRVAAAAWLPADGESIQKAVAAWLPASRTGSADSRTTTERYVP